MTGLGEHIENVELPGDLFAVLVNPLVSVPQNKTARVFALLAAPPVTIDRVSEELASIFDRRASHCLRCSSRQCA